MDLVPPPSVTHPGWLLQLAGSDALLLSDALALLVIANYPTHGAGALKAFEGMAVCLEAWHEKTGDEAAAQWAQVARKLVAYGHRLTAQFAHVTTPTTREHERPVWGVFLRLSDLSGSDHGLHDGAASLGGLLLLAQLQRTRAQHEEVAAFKPMPTKAAARLLACAQASKLGSRSETATAWLGLSTAPEFTASSFAQAANATKVGEVRALASTLTNALARLSKVAPPGSLQPIVPGSSQKPGGSAPSTSSKRTKKPRKERPGAAGLMKTASFATMAQAFGVFRYWHWLAPDELKPVVGKLVAALQSEEDGTDAADFSLVALVSLVMSHDHDVTLKLSLKKNGDIWFCPDLGCAFVDRGVLLELEGPRGSHGYVLVVFPALVVAAIRHRLKTRPDAEVLGDLMQTTPDEAWLSAAEHFTSQLGDPSHPPKSARLSHSLGLVYLETGAPPVVAANQSLNWCLCADSAGNYYGISARTANAAAGKVFERLGLGAPEELPEEMVSGRPDMPNDDDIRNAWAKAGAPVQDALQRLPTQTGIQECLALFNAAMVACWRALPLVDAGRPLRPDRPTLADCLTHSRWYRRDDKDLRENGARLLLRTEQATDVMGAAIALRLMLICRLRALGIGETQLPRTLVDAKPAASLFVEVDWKTDRSGRLVARTFSDGMLKANPQPWSGLFNLGRVFWLCESAVANEEWAEQLLSGHGRGMASVGSIALSRPVMELMNGVAPLVERTLQRLDLPRFAGGLHAPAPTQPAQLDLRSIDRRATLASRPSDIPHHHVDSDTLPALVIIDACHAELGRGPAMPPPARVLMALICASGLMHSRDVVAAWAALANKTVKADTPWHEWQRVSGQRIRMPKLPQTWIATDICSEWPTLAEAEGALRTWLVDRFPGVQWPAREGATIVALCYLAARWIRLHVPPFLVDAYRPERLAGTFDQHSNARLCSTDAREPLAPMDLPRPRLVLRKKEPPNGTPLQQLTEVMRKRVRRNLKLGGYEARARRIGEVIKARFDLDDTSPVAKMVAAWLLQEASRWNPRAPKRDAPSTWVEYLRRMLPVLERYEKEGRDPASFAPEDWKALGAAIVNTDDVEDPAEWPRVRTERHHALARMVVLLARDPRYPDAVWAISTRDAAGTPARYRPAKASALVTGFDIEACAWLLQLMQADWPLESLMLEAQLRITWEGCARADETNAMALSDVSADGTQVSFRPHNFTHLKREWNHRTNELSHKTTAVVQAVREGLLKLPGRRAFLFSQEDARVDLRLGRAMQAKLIAMLRAISGNALTAWHSLRGGGLMQRLVAEWEKHLTRYLSGPLQLRHAQALMDGLKGNSINHFASALGCSGHLSPGVPIRHYLTAWPYWYSCAMRTALAPVRVSPELADALPGADRRLLSTANHRYRNDGDVDDWAWALKRLHYPGWRKDRDPLRQMALPPLAPAQDDRQVPVINQTRYLLLRTLKLDTTTAAGTARIAHRRALRLEPMGSLLKRFDEIHQPADGLPASEVMCASSVRMLHMPVGDDLFKAIVHAPAPAHDVLHQWLACTGPMPNADRARCVLQTLPAEVGLHFGWAPGIEPIALTSDQHELRIRSEPASKHTGEMPRVRIFRVPAIGPATTGEKPRLNDHTTALLTALAKLTLQIRPHLR